MVSMLLFAGVWAGTWLALRILDRIAPKTRPTFATIPPELVELGNLWRSFGMTTAEAHMARYYRRQEPEWTESTDMNDVERKFRRLIDPSSEIPLSVGSTPAPTPQPQRRK